MFAETFSNESAVESTAKSFFPKKNRIKQLAKEVQHESVAGRVPEFCSKQMLKTALKCRY